MKKQTKGYPSESPNISTSAETQSSGALPVADDPPGDEPMTWPWLGKLFGLPLVIIGVIVASAMVVVLSFGAPAATQQRPLDDLLLALESSGGRKSMGMLFPRDKEHWQAGLELTKRLETKDREFTDADLKSVADRVGVMVRSELADRAGLEVPPGSPSEASTRLDFLIRALGLTEQPGVIDVLVDVIRDAPPRYSAVAMQQVGGLAHLPGASDAVDQILQRLSEESSAELQLVACTVLSVVADASDRRVIEALSLTRLSAEHGEVAWSAALALARLGSARGKSTLMDLLDRSFWETGNRYRETTGEGEVLRYRMPPNRVDDVLVAAVDAAANLHDADLWKMIERLQSDPSGAVRRRATESVTRREHQPGVED